MEDPRFPARRARHPGLLPRQGPAAGRCAGAPSGVRRRSIRATAPSCGCCWPRPCAGWARSTRCWARMIERPLDGANAPACGDPAAGRGAAAVPRHARPCRGRYLGAPGRRRGLPHLKGLANAVLRRISREGAALLGDRDPGRLNTPRWLWESWSASYGEEATRAIAAAHLIEAPLDLTPRSNAEFWAGRLEGEVLPTGSIRRDGRRQRHRAAGLRRGRVVGAGRRRHPARPPAGRHRRQARRRSLRRAGRQDPAALRRRRRRSRPSTSRPAAWRGSARTSPAPVWRPSW